MPYKKVIISLAQIAILSLACNLSTLLKPTQEIPFVSEPPSSQISTSVKYEYYTINGTTKDHLKSEMNLNGPVDDEGNLYFGRTAWHVSWSYPYSQTTDSCSTGPITVSIQITVYLPSWEPPANASLTLITKWTAYISALELHEQEHVEVGKRAGSEILSTFETLGPYSTCAELERVADSFAETVLKPYHDEEILYDEKTEHGKTQGAVFP